MNADNPLIRNLIEPDYQTSPRYWRVFFGSSQSVCHWLVIDGDRLYFDRNGTGDLSEIDNLVSPSDRRSPQEQTFRVGDVFEKGQATGHRKLTIFASESGIDLRVFLNWGPVQGAHSIGSLDRETAPEIVLNGPLRLTPIDNEDEFVCSTRVGENRIEIRLTAIVGTPTSCGTSISFISNDPFPDDLNPVAEIQFLDDSMTPVEEPLVVRLDSRSCECQFFASIDPRLVKTNRANVRLVFDRQTPVPVAPFEFHTRIDLNRVVDDSCKI